MKFDNSVLKFDNSEEVESIVWQLKLSDFRRGDNRRKINDLLNGEAPYTQQEEEENHLNVNVNPLGGTKIAHDGRRQYYSAFLKQGKFFHARCDMGPAHKRVKHTTTVTREINRIMKRSPLYFETLRSKFALLIAHGIGPAIWDDRDMWCPDAIGVEDVLIPGNTLLTMKNVPFYAIYRSYTGAQLRRLTRGPKVDPAWNMPLVDSMIEWVDKEGSTLMGTQWPEAWSPEKMAERFKGDGGLTASDGIPTIDCYDFRFWNDDNKKSGWNRRIVLDAYGNPGIGGTTLTKGENRYGTEAKGFLYDSKDRKYADKMSENISFQFADLSAVAPFRYHSVRSLGYIIWAVSHLQNRLYCALQDATFESLCQYFRVKSQEDVERALKVNLFNRAFIDESIQMIPQAERWQTNMPLAEFAYNQNQQIINENSSSYVQRQDYSDAGKERKTKFQVMAEVNATTALVSAGLLQAYQYQTFENMEVFRRFMKANSKDPDVREFRKNVLKAGVPEELLMPEAWEISNEQVMGAGNKTMEMTIAQQLLEMMPKYDPPAQRKILRDVTLAITDNAAMTDELVPERPDKITDTVHESQQAVANILLGLPISPYAGQNHIEAAETWIGEMAMVLHQLESTGEMPTPKDVLGLQNFAKHIGEQIKIIAQDEAEAERVKKYSQELQQLTKMVQDLAMKVAKARQAQAQQNGQQSMDPKDQAKIQATIIGAKVKADSATKSHGARTAQKQVTFEQTQRQKDEKHQQDLQHKTEDARLDLHKKAAEAEIDIRTQRSKMKSTEE